eukprot:g9373.t1
MGRHRQYRPGVVLVTTGIKKGKKQGPEQLKKIIGAAWNRPELLEMALKKYKKIKQKLDRKLQNTVARAKEEEKTKPVIFIFVHLH